MDLYADPKSVRNNIFWFGTGIGSIYEAVPDQVENELEKTK